MPRDDRESQSIAHEAGEQPTPQQLVTVESQREFDLLTGRRSERTFLKLYVEARTSGMLAAISDRDWKTLCTLATYMDENGYCYPSQAELARAMGCSRQMANERIKSLANFRFQGKPVVLVEREGRSEHGTWTRNGYHILPIAHLGIFDGDNRPADRRKSNRPTWARADEEEPTVSRNPDTGETMSRNLDTAENGSMSSDTVPVELDTNQNQNRNQNQNDSNIRKTSTPGKQGTGTAGDGSGRARRPEYDEDREVILEYVSDFAREFGDQAPLSSSVTRIHNLYRESRLNIEEFVDAMYQARSITKERRASIRSGRFPYFLRVLEDVVGLREEQ